MFESILSVFDDTQLLPHASCLLWRPDLLWLHAVSDTLIALAYYSIPVALLVFAVRRRDLHFRWMFVLFGIFILACGTTHLMSIWTLWVPAWGWSGLVKVVTAVSSVGTAILLWPLIPKALALPGEQQWLALNQHLRAEVEERRAAETQVRELNRALEERVLERTAELEAINQKLRENEAKIRAILETAADGIITIDELGHILTVNPAVERLFGYAAEDLVGQNITSLMPDSYKPIHESYLARYRRTGEHRIIGRGAEVEGRRKDGSTFPMELAVGEAVVEGGRFFTGIVRDISERKRAEVDIRDSEAKTRAILETAVDGILSIDESGLILSANRAAERLFEYTAKEMVGQNVTMLMPEPYHSEHDGYLLRYRTTGERRIIGIGREVQGRRKDGSVFPMDLAVGEAVVGERRIFTGIIRDITERKKANEELRQSEERFRLLIDNVRDYAITWLDVDGHIASWNVGAERIYGWAADEILGRPMETFYPQEETFEAAKALVAVRESGRYEGEGWRIRKDGTRFWAHVNITPLWDPSGNMRGFVRVARDITERKRAEEALRSAKEEAERANIAKSKFLAAASHDLRQPVQALVFFASALETKMGGSPNATVLNDMKGSLEALNTLLDALLDVSRLDAGIVVPQPTNFSLSVLFDRMVSEFTPLAADKKLKLRAISPSVIVRSDPILLGRIIRNLLANAVRYTRRGRILLGSRRHGDTVHIEIWDTGMGIPEGRLKDIFQEFYQISNTERDRSQGLGLGLAIVQRLSRLLECRVTVRSWEGRGSVFSVEVPVIGYSKARNVAFLETEPPDGKAVAGMVLVIDDEILILKGLRMIIESWGYDVLTATSEEEAVETIAKAPRVPDIIIADYRLRQGHTGAEAILNIRRHLDRPIPAIIITGDTAPERLQEAKAHGLKLLHKPVQPLALQLVIAEHVEPSA